MFHEFGAKATVIVDIRVIVTPVVAESSHILVPINFVDSFPLRCSAPVRKSSRFRQAYRIHQEVRFRPHAHAFLVLVLLPAFSP